MEAEPCKLQEVEEEDMEEGVGEERNMLVTDKEGEEEEEKAEEMGGGRDGPLTILIPRSPPPPQEPGVLNIGHSSLIFPPCFLSSSINSEQSCD